MANVYQIVQQSGGEIKVESGENKGARFTVKFPLPDPQPRTNREYSAAE
jgi:signal transduction histidine kinase